MPGESLGTPGGKEFLHTTNPPGHSLFLLIKIPPQGRPPDPQPFRSQCLVAAALGEDDLYNFPGHFAKRPVVVKQVGGGGHILPLLLLDDLKHRVTLNVSGGSFCSY